MNEADLASVLEHARAPVVQRVVGDPSALVRDITHDSRSVTPGAIFCCIRGEHVDGHLFAEEAVDAGASALVVDHVLDVSVPQVVVDDVRSAAGPIAASVFDHPSDRLTIVGVTGTNGKTTTTHLLAAVFEAAALPCGVIGTLSGAHTTPEAPDLQRRLAQLAADGKRAVAMEVSSARARPPFASTAPASRRRCSPTSAATTSTCTARRSATSPPRRGCSSRR